MALSLKYVVVGHTTNGTEFSTALFPGKELREDEESALILAHDTSCMKASYFSRCYEESDEPKIQEVNVENIGQGKQIPILIQIGRKGYEKIFIKGLIGINESKIEKLRVEIVNAYVGMVAPWGRVIEEDIKVTFR